MCYEGPSGRIGERMSGIRMSICCTNGRTFGKGDSSKEHGGFGSSTVRNALPIYYGGDRIEGRLVLNGCERQDFDAVKFSFQGILQQSLYNVDAHGVITYQMHVKRNGPKLFKLVDVQPSHNFLSLQNDSESTALETSFRFNIPASTHLPTPSSTQEQHSSTSAPPYLDDFQSSSSATSFANLPSSVCTAFSTSRPKQRQMGWHGDCCIIFIIHASLISHNLNISHTSQLLTVFSHPKTPKPPLCITDFPHEYQLYSSKSMRSLTTLGLISTGKFSLTTHEPDPFIFKNGNQAAYTVLKLDLESLIYGDRARVISGKRSRSVNDIGSGLSNRRFSILGKSSLATREKDITTAEVTYQIKSTTFSSLRESPFKASPRVMDTIENPWVTKSEHLYRKRSCTMPFLPWSEIPSGTFGVGSVGNEKNGISRKTTTHLVVRFEGEDGISPPPTFESSWVCRRYSLLVGVVVREPGMASLRLEVEVPVQVVHEVELIEKSYVGERGEEGSLDPIFESETLELEEARDEPPMYAP